MFLKNVYFNRDFSTWSRLVQNNTGGERWKTLAQNDTGGGKTLAQNDTGSRNRLHSAKCHPERNE